MTSSNDTTSGPFDAATAKISEEELPQELASVFNVARNSLRKVGECEPAAAVFKDGEMKVMTFVRGGGLQAGLIAKLLLPAFSADTFIHVSDSYVSKVRINPQTGEDWGAGEMGMYFEMGNADNVISECLMGAMSCLDGTEILANQRYVRVNNLPEFEAIQCRKGKLNTDTERRGRLQDAIATAFSNVGTLTVVSNDLGVVDQDLLDYSQAHSLKVLMKTGVVKGVMMSEELARAVQEAMDDVNEPRNEMYEEIVKQVKFDYGPLDNID